MTIRKLLQPHPSPSLLLWNLSHLVSIPITLWLIRGKNKYLSSRNHCFFSSPHNSSWSSEATLQIKASSGTQRYNKTPASSPYQIPRFRGLIWLWLFLVSSLILTLATTKMWSYSRKHFLYTLVSRMLVLNGRFTSILQIFIIVLWYLIPSLTYIECWTIIGSCVDAGFEDCCNSDIDGSCIVNGFPSCFCDQMCYLFNDCCFDIAEICPCKQK